MVTPAGESEEGGDRKEAGRDCPMDTAPRLRRFWEEPGGREWPLCWTGCCWSREGSELRPEEMLEEVERPWTRACISSS